MESPNESDAANRAVPTRVTARIGLVCSGLAIALLLPSFALHCVARALWVGGFSLLDGALFGTALAVITRTRRPVYIYLSLLLAGLTLWPLFISWPPASADEIHLWPHALDLLLNYFDILRPCLFLLGFPYPFARLGYHAPDEKANP